MKLIISKLAIVFVLLFYMGCTTGTEVITKKLIKIFPGNKPSQNGITGSYSGPKAKIAVIKFGDKTRNRWWSRDFGNGMEDQMVTELVRSNRFVVLERADMNALEKEWSLGSSGYIREDEAAQIGKMLGADLIVIGNVTEFEEKAIEANAGIIDKCRAIYNQSHIAVDIKVIDSETSEIITATSVEGKSGFNFMKVLPVLFKSDSSNKIYGSLFKNKSTEKAIRECIQSAIIHIAKSIPQEYYRYNKSPRFSSNDTNFGNSVIVKSSKLNVRSGPGTSHSVLFGVNKGDRLNVIKRIKGWIQIKTQDARVGWVYGKSTI